MDMRLRGRGWGPRPACLLSKGGRITPGGRCLALVGWKTRACLRGDWSDLAQNAEEPKTCSQGPVGTSVGSGSGVLRGRGLQLCSWASTEVVHEGGQEGSGGSWANPGPGRGSGYGSPRGRHPWVIFRKAGFPRAERVLGLSFVCEGWRWGAWQGGSVPRAAGVRSLCARPHVCTLAHSPSRVPSP